MEAWMWLILHSFMSCVIIYLYVRYRVVLNLVKLQQRRIEDYSTECDEHYNNNVRITKITKIAHSYKWVISFNQLYNETDERYDISRITIGETNNNWQYQALIDLPLESIESFFQYYEMTLKNGIKNPSLIDVVKVRDKFEKALEKVDNKL